MNVFRALCWASCLWIGLAGAAQANLAPPEEPRVPQPVAAHKLMIIIDQDAKAPRLEVPKKLVEDVVGDAGLPMSPVQTGMAGVAIGCAIMGFGLLGWRLRKTRVAAAGIVVSLVAGTALVAQADIAFPAPRPRPQPAPGVDPMIQAGDIEVRVTDGQHVKLFLPPQAVQQLMQAGGGAQIEGR